MHILIIGAAGMVGRKLAAKLSSDGHLGGKGALFALENAGDVSPPFEPLDGRQ